MERVLAMMMEASASAAVFGCNTYSYMRFAASRRVSFRATRLAT
jgi:hypothetical protein